MLPRFLILSDLIKSFLVDELQTFLGTRELSFMGEVEGGYFSGKLDELHNVAG